MRWRTVELALALTSLSTTAAALWLLTVSVTVLPARDPGHVEFWRTVAVALLAFVVAGLAYLRPGVRGALERVPLAALGTIATGLGLGSILRESAAGRAGAHPEGYLLLLGALVAAHGVAALGVALPSARDDTARRA